MPHMALKKNMDHPGGIHLKTKFSTRTVDQCAQG